MEQGLGRKAGKASVFVLGISVLKVLQQIVSIAIIARLIAPGEYGIYAMALPGVMIAMALSNFGLPQAIVQHKTITHARVSALFWLNLAFALIITIALIVLAGPAAEYYGEPAVKPVFQIVSLSLLFSAMSSQYLAILRRTLQVRAAEVITLVCEIIGLVVAIAAAFAGLSYWALVLQQIVTPLLKTVVMAVRTGWRPSGPHKVPFLDAVDSVSFGGFVAGFSIMNRLTEYVGTVIAGAMFGTAATGLFYRARNLAGIPPKRVMIPLSGVFVPTMSRLQDSPEELQAMFRRLVSRANLILLPVAVLIAAGSEPLVALMLGPDWSAAAPLLLWMSIFTFREAGSSGLQFAMIACGKSKPLFFFSAFRLLMIAAVMYASARYGVIVMTAAYMLAELFVTLPLMALVAQRVTPITLKVFARSCLADMVFAAVLALALIFGLNPLLVETPAVLQFAAVLVALAAAYGVRIAVSADLRRDVLRALSGITDKLKRRAGKA